MTPDDPRHGTNAGYSAGCRQTCCRKARADYERNRRKRAELYGERRYVDGTGTARRIRALQRLGWSAGRIAKQAGYANDRYLQYVLETNRCHARTRDRVAVAYSKLSMRIPTPSRSTTRVRNYAIKAGWPAPLAWDEDAIDDPNARPHGAANGKRKTDVDPVAVERAMAGDRIQLTRDERYEVVARLRNMGRSLGWIEEHTVITKAERYLARGDAA